MKRIFLLILLINLFCNPTSEKNNDNYFPMDVGNYYHYSETVTYEYGVTEKNDVTILIIDKSLWNGNYIYDFQETTVNQYSETYVGIVSYSVQEDKIFIVDDSLNLKITQFTIYPQNSTLNVNTFIKDYNDEYVKYSISYVGTYQLGSLIFDDCYSFTTVGENYTKIDVYAPNVGLIESSMNYSDYVNVNRILINYQL